MFTNSLVSVTSVRPSISRSEGHTDDVTVTKGGDVTLQCAAEGVPRPAITWLKDGRPIAGQQRAVIQNEGRMLQIKDAKVSDTGRYTCIAVNVAGQADRKHDISVHGMRFFFCFFLLVSFMLFGLDEFGPFQCLKFSFWLFLSFPLLLFSPT